MENCNEYFQNMDREEFKAFLEDAEIEFEEGGSGEIIYTNHIETEIKFTIHGTFNPEKSVNKSKGEIQQTLDGNFNFLMAC